MVKMRTSTSYKNLHLIKDDLDDLYEKFNHRKYIHPDPIKFIYEWEDRMEREIVGFIASSLAYGRVSQILKSVSEVLKFMKPSPLRFVYDATPLSLKGRFSRFKHRFSTGEELADLIMGIKRILGKYSSLHICFKSHMQSTDSTVIPALSAFVREISHGFLLPKNSLISSPECGSACKRLHLYLKWMIRHDDVDPGCWNDISPSKLIIPIDTHMLTISKTLGITSRKCSDIQTAIEITDAFRTIAPDDPAKYDFCLTRLGILKNGEAFLNKLAEKLRQI